MRLLARKVFELKSSGEKRGPGPERIVIATMFTTVAARTMDAEETRGLRF
jgi:hypothetical protein